MSIPALFRRSGKVTAIAGAMAMLIPLALVVSQEWPHWDADFPTPGAAALVLFIAVVFVLPLILGLGALPGLMVIYFGDLIEARRQGISVSTLRFRRRWEGSDSQ